MYHKSKSIFKHSKPVDDYEVVTAMAFLWFELMNFRPHEMQTMDLSFESLQLRKVEEDIGWRRCLVKHDKSIKFDRWLSFQFTIRVKIVVLNAGKYLHLHIN